MTAKEEYAIYLQSPHWLGLRAAALNRDKRRCRRCGKKHSLQVHHIFYRRFWMDTRLEDLLTLCEFHHERAHKLLDKPKPVPVVAVAPVPIPNGAVYGLNGFEKKTEWRKAQPALIGWTNKQFSQVKKSKKGRAFFKAQKKARKKRQIKAWKQRLFN